MGSHIIFTHGDMFERTNTIVVIPTNCVGVMGKGVALQFARLWPWSAEDYNAECRLGLIKPGVLREYALPTDPERLAVMLPTKRHWRNDSRIEDVEAGIIALRVWIDESEWREGTRIAIPPLGCGNGGLAWPAVRALLIRHLTGVEIDVVIYGA